MQNESIDNPTWVPIVAAIAGGVLVLGGIVNLLSDQRQLFGGILAIVLGLLALAGGIKMLTNKTFMMLTPEGIVPPTGGLLPWGDIEDLRLVTIGAGKDTTRFIHVALRDRTRYDASQRLGASAPLRWKVLTAAFGRSVVERARAYAINLPR